MILLHPSVCCQACLIPPSTGMTHPTVPGQERPDVSIWWKPGPFTGDTEVAS